MLIFEKTVSGKTFPISTSPSETISDLKQRILQQAGLPSELVRVWCNGEALNEQNYVSVLSNESELHLEWDAEGGKKKKRKKKAFTSKKRVPHTRKKEKLKVLKLFKVKDGNVEPTHKECPNCPGCFLAKHKDGRLYCGNCHYTEKKGK